MGLGCGPGQRAMQDVLCRRTTRAHPGATLELKSMTAGRSAARSCTGSNSRSRTQKNRPRAVHLVNDGGLGRNIFKRQRQLVADIDAREILMKQLEREVSLVAILL